MGYDTLIGGAIFGILVCVLLYGSAACIGITMDSRYPTDEERPETQKAPSVNRGLV
jgi:hypothetical protein